MDTCRCHRSVQSTNRHRLTRRATLQVAGLVTASAMVPGLTQPIALAQSATPAASPDAGTTPDLTGVAPLPLTGELLAEFESFVAAKVRELDVPGVSVAVVQGGSVAYQQGFGVREVGHPEPVTADTLLRIGSITKSFSSMLLGTVVDAGRVSWDTPLADLLPTFAVADPDLTAQLTVQDAFCACTGVPRRDIEFQTRAYELTPELLVEGMAQLPLTAPYGEKFQYSNQMVAAGGFATAIADGGAPDDLSHAYDIALRDRVLNPIGMSRTTLFLSDVVTDDNYATPHAPDLEGAAVPLPLLVDDEWIRSVAPTGALWSSASEMARYIQTELSRGVAPDGQRVISAENLERTWQPGVRLGSAPETPPLFADSMQHYALGWIVGTYHGQRLVSHTGGTYGFNSLVAFLPDADLGLVVLTNVNGTGGTLGYATQFRLLELVFAQPDTIDSMISGAIAGIAAGQADLLSHLGQVDPVVVEPFLGRYSNPALGELTLALRNGTLVFDTGGGGSTLIPRLDDAGSVIDYVIADPPWASNPPVMNFTLEDNDGSPRVILTALADPGEAALMYPFERVDPVAAIGTSI